MDLFYARGQLRELLGALVLLGADGVLQRLGFDSAVVVVQRVVNLWLAVAPKAVV